MSVCGTEIYCITLEVFLGSALPMVYCSCEQLPKQLGLLIKQSSADFPTPRPRCPDDNPISRHEYSPSSLHRTIYCHGILTVCPSPPPFGIGLGPTNSSLITIAKKTLVFRRRGVLPRLWLLVLAFSLLYAPPWFPPLASTRVQNALLPLDLSCDRTNPRFR